MVSCSASSPTARARWPADYLTRRVASLKDHLGIADKRPETIARRGRGLRAEPQHAGTPPGRQAGRRRRAEWRSGVGRRLGRSDRWAQLAVASAQRREAAASTGGPTFDGSIIALRKFTSSELLDAGFNLGGGPTTGSRPAGARQALRQGPPVGRPQGRRAPGSGRPWWGRRWCVVRPNALERNVAAHVALARVNHRGSHGGDDATATPDDVRGGDGEALGISRSLAYELVRRGEIPSLRLGRRIVVPVRALEELVRQAGAAAPV